MAKESKVIEKLRAMGVEPIENRCIVVQYAAPNLSESIVRFLGMSEAFYVLQLAQDELVLATLEWTGRIKDEGLLRIPFEKIQSIEIEPFGLNYRIMIETEDGPLTLTTQQKELAGFRNSGALSMENFWGTESWHINNLDKTLKDLEKLAKSE